MSYILDALKKRQTQDDPDAAVSLALLQAQKSEVQQRRITRALWVIGAALLVNAVVLGIWALRDDAPRDALHADAAAPAETPSRPLANDPLMDERGSRYWLAGARWRIAPLAVAPRRWLSTDRP